MFVFWYDKNILDRKKGLTGRHFPINCGVVQLSRHINIRGILSTLSKRRCLIAVFVIALVLRLTVFFINQAQVGPQSVMENCFDCKLYMNMARSIQIGADLLEHGFFYFGPGYAGFLASNMLIVGDELTALILINILISSISCIFIYLLAMYLTRSYAISVIAAFLSAVSYTSIMLSNYIMSDTLFVLVFLLALLLLLKALFSGKWKFFIWAGIFAAAAMLVRSVGQFWPPVMAFIAFAYTRRKRRGLYDYRFTTGEIIGKVSVPIAIVLVVMSGWILRNYIIHDVPTMGLTSAISPANIAAVTVERLEGKPSNEVLWGWVDDYCSANNKPEATFGELSKVYYSQASLMSDSLGWEYYKTYVLLIWENLNTVCFLHRYLMPEYNYIIIPIEDKIKNTDLKYICVIMSALGLLSLFLMRRFFPAIVLGTTYFYFLASIGSFRWQGYRHFFPGQIAWTILIAVFIVYTALFFKWLFTLLRNRPTSPNR
jgi:4-amino-4-deoxy-L-arabinose transferase-like glycosyltransferase